MFNLDPAAIFQAVTWAAGLAVSGFVGYLFKRLDKEEKAREALAKEFFEFVKDVPKQYVGKDDYRTDIGEMKEMFREIRADVKALSGKA